MRKPIIAAITAIGASLAIGRAQAADLTVWGLQAFNQAADEYIGQMVKEFGKAKGIDAEYVVVPATVINDRLAASFQGGAPPDAYMQVSQRAQFYIGNGLTVPLDDVLADMRKVPGGIFENQLAVRQGRRHDPGATARGRRLAVICPQGPAGRGRQEAAADLGRIARGGAPHPAETSADRPLRHAVSNANDAESNLRNVIWSFGGKVMAEDGKTVVFNSPETRAAYQFIADMFLKDRTIPRAALTWDDCGNNIAYQTGARRLCHQPAQYLVLDDRQRQKAARQHRSDQHPERTGPEGHHRQCRRSWVWQVTKASKHPDWAKDWLRWFYQPERYRM